MADKKYNSVSDLIGDISSDKEFNKTLKNEIESRQIAKILIALRCKAGMGQKEFAQKVGCSQGKISKIENSYDMDLSIRDLAKYCNAAGMTLEIGFSDKNLTLKDRVIYHYFNLKIILEKIIELSKGDEVMEKGAEGFMFEALANIFNGLLECAHKATTRVKRKEKSPIHVSNPISIDNVKDVERKELAGV